MSTRISCDDAHKNYIIRAGFQEKLQVGMCTHQRLRSACTSAKTDVSSMGILWVTNGPMFLQVDN